MSTKAASAGGGGKSERKKRDADDLRVVACLIGIVAGCACASWLTFRGVGRVVPLARQAPIDLFSEGRVLASLEALTSIGPKETGSIANEVATPMLLMTEIVSAAADSTSPGGGAVDGHASIGRRANRVRKILTQGDGFLKSWGRNGNMLYNDPVADVDPPVGEALFSFPYFTLVQQPQRNETSMRDSADSAVSHCLCPPLSLEAFRQRLAVMPCEADANTLMTSQATRRAPPEFPLGCNKATEHSPTVTPLTNAKCDSNARRDPENIARQLLRYATHRSSIFGTETYKFCRADDDLKLCSAALRKATRNPCAGNGQVEGRYRNDVDLATEEGNDNDYDDVDKLLTANNFSGGDVEEDEKFVIGTERYLLMATSDSKCTSGGSSYGGGSPLYLDVSFNDRFSGMHVFSMKMVGALYLPYKNVANLAFRVFPVAMSTSASPSDSLHFGRFENEASTVDVWVDTVRQLESILTANDDERRSSAEGTVDPDLRLWVNWTLGRFAEEIRGATAENAPLRADAFWGHVREEAKKIVGMTKSAAASRKLSTSSETGQEDRVDDTVDTGGGDGDSPSFRTLGNVGKVLRWVVENSLDDERGRWMAQRKGHSMPLFQNKNFPRGVLLASHYDTSPRAVGGADAAACSVTIIEVVRSITAKHFLNVPLSSTGDNESAHAPFDYRSQRASTVSKDWKRPVYGNLNGAEETILMAADGFAKLHPWFNNIAAFINLEAAGTAGREFMLQSNSDALINLYAAVTPHPHATAIASDLFERGLVPGVTDYAIYATQQGVPGYDLAWGSRGWRYHTPRDDIYGIEPGSIQRYGENVRALTEGLMDLSDAQIAGDVPISIARRPPMTAAAASAAVIDDPNSADSKPMTQSSQQAADAEGKIQKGSILSSRSTPIIADNEEDGKTVRVVVDDNRHRDPVDNKSHATRMDGDKSSEAIDRLWADDPMMKLWTDEKALAEQVAAGNVEISPRSDAGEDQDLKHDGGCDGGARRGDSTTGNTGASTGSAGMEEDPMIPMWMTEEKFRKEAAAGHVNVVSRSEESRNPTTQTATASQRKTSLFDAAWTAATNRNSAKAAAAQAADRRPLRPSERIAARRNQKAAAHLAASGASPVGLTGAQPGAEGAGGSVGRGLAYFDLLGWKCIVLGVPWTATAAVSLWWLSVSLEIPTIAPAYRNIAPMRIAIPVAFLALASVAGLVASSCTAALVFLSGFRLRWMTELWVAGLLYAPPAAFTVLYLQHVAMPRWTLRLLPFLATPPRVEVLQARKLYQSDIQTLGTLAFQTAYHSSGGVIALLTLFFLYKGFRSTYSPALLLIAMAVSRMLAMTIAFWWPIISTVPPPPPEATAVLSEGSSVSGETAADKSNTVCRNQEGMSSQATATSTTRESDSRTATETTASSPESGAVESAATSASCGNVDMETTTRVLTRVVNRPANTQNLKITEATARPMPLPGPLKPRSAGEIEGSERVEHAMTRISFRDNLWSVVLQTALFCFCIIPMLVHYIAALDHLLPAFNRLSVDGFAEIITAALVALATVLTIPAALSGLALVDQRSLKSWLPRLAVAWIGLAAAVLVGSQPWTVMTPKRVDIVHYSKSTHRSSYNLNRIPSNATADVAGDARLEAEERRSEVERISSAGILMQTVDDEGMREEILRHYQHRVRKLLLHVTGYRGRPRGPDGDDIWSFKKLQCDALDRKDCTLSVPHGILPRTIATKTMHVMEFDGFPPPLADKATVDGVWTLPLSNRPMSWGKNVADEQARDPPATWIGAFLNEQFVTQLCGIDWQDLPAGRRCAVMAVKRFSFGRGPSMFTGAGASTSADFFDANRLAEPFSSAFPELVVSWNVAPVEGSDGRRVKVKIDVRAGCRQVLLFPQTGVVGWSLSSELPPPREDCDCHAILYNSSSAGPSDLHMWIDVDLETLPRSGREGEEKQPELSFSVVSLRFQLITPFVAIGLDTLAYNQMRNEFEANAQPFQPPQDKANQASPPLSSFSNGDAFDAIRFKDLSLPDWVSPVSSASELQEYKIVFSGLRDQRRR